MSSKKSMFELSRFPVFLYKAIHGCSYQDLYLYVCSVLFAAYIHTYIHMCVASNCEIQDAINVGRVKLSPKKLPI